MLHCIYPMVVWFNELQFALVLSKNLFDMFCCLIVHHVQLWLTSLPHQLLELCSIHIENAYIVKSSDRYWDDTI